MIIKSTEVQNNFGKFLKYAKEEDVIVTKNGKKTACIINYEKYKSNTGLITLREGSSAYSHNGMNVSYEEFLKIAENSENRYEYINGRIYLLASPAYGHQKAVREIFFTFTSWFKGKKCEPVVSPFDVTLIRSNNEISVIQPDIVVICDTENIDKKGKYKGTPALVIEVLSQSTKSKDLFEKLNLYMSNGISEYWIVNPKSKDIMIYHFKDKEIEEYNLLKKGQTVKSYVFKGLTVDVDEVFA